MSFDWILHKISSKSYGYRTAIYETPLNQNRKRHKIFKKQFRLRIPYKHCNESIQMDFENMASLERRLKLRSKELMQRRN